MTPQQIFDRVWDWFIVQGKPRGLGPMPACRGKAAGHAEDTCRYRGRKINGERSRCVLGLFIPDEKYTIDLEKLLPCNEGDRDRLSQVTGIPVELMPFMDQLQSAHDDVVGRRGSREYELNFRLNLTRVAREYDLLVAGVSPQPEDADDYEDEDEDE